MTTTEATLEPDPAGAPTEPTHEAPGAHWEPDGEAAEADAEAAHWSEHHLLRAGAGFVIARPSHSPAFLLAKA